MTAPIIPADQWPEGADRHCWDAGGQGYFYGLARAGSRVWLPFTQQSDIPMPAGHDWRVPVLRPSAELAIDLDLVREAVEVAIAHAGPNDGSLAGWRRLLALIDGQGDTTVVDTLRTLLARELLANCLEDFGHPQEARNVRDGEDLESYEVELRLIRKLHAYGCLRLTSEPLTAPPGYVLVPIDPSDQQLMWMDGHDEASQRRAYAGLIAAAPAPDA